MDIINVLPLIYAKLYIFMLISARIGSFLYAFIIFRQVSITYRLTIPLTLLISFYVLMLHPVVSTQSVLSVSSLFNMAVQSLIGFAGAFILNTTFEVFLFSGQVVSTQIGLSIASLIDPRYGMLTSLSQFYLLTSIMLFFAFDGHLWMVKLLIDTFSVMPIEDAHISGLLGKSIQYTSVIFSSGVILSLIVIAVNMLLSIAIALISKFSPQFNIFTIGILIQLILGFILLNLIFHTTIMMSENIIQKGFLYLQTTAFGIATHV